LRSAVGIGGSMKAKRSLSSTLRSPGDTQAASDLGCPVQEMEELEDSLDSSLSTSS
jgi:hypothetical protein